MKDFTSFENLQMTCFPKGARTTSYERLIKGLPERMMLVYFVMTRGFILYCACLA